MRILNWGIYSEVGLHVGEIKYSIIKLYYFLDFIEPYQTVV